MTRAVASAIRKAADPERARQGFESVLSTAVVADAKQARILAALFSGSPAMTALLGQHPEWVDELTPDRLAHPRQEQGLRREVDGILHAANIQAHASRSGPADPAGTVPASDSLAGHAGRVARRTEAGGSPAPLSGDCAGALARLRLFKQREMLRIAARDLAGLGDTAQHIREISNVADVCLHATLQLCRAPLVERLGQPWHQDADGRWQPTEFCVIGLGKLGGQELNYSSDVDVLFVYAEEGVVFKTPPRVKIAPEHAMVSHLFFKRLAESFVAEISRATAEGALYRIDLRLRPEGDAGPLVRSLPSYESFYAQWGQTWERMMLIKARGVAGDAGLAAEFLETIHPFRYPRSLGEGALREIAAMKARTENEVIRAGELDRDVKRGRGGIREIEFIVQTAQMLNAGRIPFLQGAQTLPLLQKLAQYKLLTDTEASGLREAYCFLRDVEHRLQMEHNLQTHTLPADAPARARLAALMDFARPADFEAALKRHTQLVRANYEKFVRPEETGAPSPFPRQFQGAEPEWRKVIEAHSFRDADQAFRLLEEFAHGPGYVHTSQRTTELAMGLVPKILTMCPERRAPARPESALTGKLAEQELGAPSAILSDPNRVLARLDSFISAYGARATLFESWTHNPQLFELLLLLFDRSEFLAEIAIRTPDLVDDLVLSGRLRRSKSAEEILTELRRGAGDADQRLWLRRYHQAEFMRIGLRDILGLADYEQNFVELSALADACLQYALESVARTLKLKAPPVAVIGLGKLGGRELNYGSDLDILFVAGDKAKQQLPKLQKLAAGMMEMLSSQTELGIAFVTDARLRPDGEKGLLVNTLAAHEEYYRHRAQLWEIQALTRVRAVAGDAGVAEKFQRLAAGLTDFRTVASGVPPRPGPLPLRGGEGETSSAADWKQAIARMRARIEQERTPPGQDALAFKTGRGGLIDAEFIAQAMCLEHGWQEPNTLRALQRVRDEGALPRADAEKLIENYRRLRRVESILRRWSFEGEAVLPDDPAPFYRVSVRCGFATAEAFRQAVASWRKAIREVHQQVFPEGGNRARAR